ncbi:4-hydroxy-tetrahydrodipicolinate reductase [Jeotgalibaca arthritidis]|uniref:4-hydroxy-tetrahydrodipicolinate reductase n=1 Tax=Jeotgalibaca arthritidis TaxID=1868794 RepID=A0A6G7K8N2_9LACT|nr:4-hydroxy-tetrahydrodipicolinate reductase [Jeotgalibaca arthritidis]QII81608.1 4-hydroxy-tetrahydrodipicolinate reductase [Jeotgalibaca arthritidis]
MVLKIGLVGYGAMGRVVEESIQADDELVVFAPETNRSLADYQEKLAVLIDFSNPANLDSIVQYASDYKVPVVIATTGFSSEQQAKITALSEKVPVLMSANFSLGVMLVNRMLKDYSPILKDFFDIEVIEKHHRLKVDAPSGTAKMFADTINETLNYDFVYGREGVSKRQDKEIGIHAVRGGSIVGEHEVIFAGQDEVISIKHEAFSKRIFAVGALNGAKWLAGDKEAGFYDMNDVLFD